MYSRVLELLKWKQLPATGKNDTMRAVRVNCNNFVVGVSKSSLHITEGSRNLRCCLSLWSSLWMTALILSHWYELIFLTSLTYRYWFVALKYFSNPVKKNKKTRAGWPESHSQQILFKVCVTWHTFPKAVLAVALYCLSTSDFSICQKYSEASDMVALGHHPGLKVRNGLGSNDRQITN